MIYGLSDVQTQKVPRSGHPCQGALGRVYQKSLSSASRVRHVPHHTMLPCTPLHCYVHGWMCRHTPWPQCQQVCRAHRPLPPRAHTRTWRHGCCVVTRRVPAQWDVQDEGPVGGGREHALRQPGSTTSVVRACGRAMWVSSKGHVGQQQARATNPTSVIQFLCHAT